MSRLIILEGPRAVGKSTIAHQLRQEVNYSTLINFTGFSDSGAEGLRKIDRYYQSWFQFFFSVKNQDFTFIGDRFVFSEMVFSKLYKDYDFSYRYKHYIDQFPWVVDQINIFHLTISNKGKIKERLKRDKVSFAAVKDKAEEIFRQKREYTFLFNSLLKTYMDVENVSIHTLDTTHLTLDEVKQIIKEKAGVVTG